LVFPKWTKGVPEELTNATLESGEIEDPFRPDPAKEIRATKAYIDAERGLGLDVHADPHVEPVGPARRRAILFPRSDLRNFGCGLYGWEHGNLPVKA
jgi:hypothetical protein